MHEGDQRVDPEDHGEGHADPEPRGSGPPDRDPLWVMLHVQHRLLMARDAEERGSPAWMAAEARLDHLNGRLWHLAGTGTLPLEELCEGLDADIDSQPEDDEAFHEAVVRSIREAIAERARRDRDGRTHDRLARSAQLAEAALGVMGRASESLHRAYPAADLAATPRARDVIGVVARRDAES